jgi:hypothetical protein
MEDPATDNERLRSTDSTDAHQSVTSESSTASPNTLDAEDDASDTTSTTSDNSSDASLGDTEDSIGDGEETESGDEDETTGSENSSDAEDDRDEESSGDENDDDNPGNTDQKRGSRLLGLSNELLTSIILNLDAPSAVCFGVTCKQAHSLVLTVCKTDYIMSICPKWSDKGYDVAVPLAQYIEPKECKDIQARSFLAIRWVQKLLEELPGEKQRLPRSLLSVMRIDLNNRMANEDWDQRYQHYGESGHAPYGHSFLVGDDMPPCVICRQLGALEATARAMGGRLPDAKTCSRLARDTNISCFDARGGSGWQW